MTALSDLIARLEAAKEGSRELDADLHPTPAWHDEDCDEWRAQYGDTGGTIEVPHYTTSLDAALTLVPAGWNYQLLKTGGVLLLSGKPFSASIKAPSEYGWVDPPYPSDGYADTMPLSLCIAAMKAREAQR